MCPAGSGRGAENFSFSGNHMNTSGLRTAGVLGGLLAARRMLAQVRLAAADGRALVWTFATTLLLSALLLFSVQPMFAKLILPKLGGAPSVWAVSMCFFQAVLLAGYFYAFALNRWLADRQAMMVHLVVMALASLVLPFGVPVAFAAPPADGVYLWLIALLAVGIGLPFFAVSANAPLLQAWFSRADNPQAADPYFLYGASNLGSLAALIGYPLLMEPAIGLAAQSQIWSTGFALLGAMIALSGIMRLATGTRDSDARPAMDASTIAPAITWPQRFGWMALAFIPSGLVIAVTTYITTDVASAPFLWVLPLALFLATFILVFRSKLAFNYRLACHLLPACVLLLLVAEGLLITSLAALASFFLAAIICHRELYNRRPNANHLTEFYLWMSLGGVLGGVFSALLAPHLFTWTFEFTLLILLALLCRPGILFDDDKPFSWRRLAAIGGAGLAVMAAVALAGQSGLVSGRTLYPALVIGFLAAGLVLIRAWPEHRGAFLVVTIAGLSVTPSDELTLHVERSFFGTHRVALLSDGSMRTLLHGTTLHGAMRLKNSSGAPVTAAVPATYYHPESPMARGVAAARATFLAERRPLHVGIVGLGTGSLACYARPGEIWRTYEIDPAVARIATDPKLFDFLARCMPTPDIVIGDARLTLAQEPAQTFGYLVIDAFSSDSIPVHLLTAEALKLFIDKLDPDGLLALHISNRYLDLAPALASTIALVPGAMAAQVTDRIPIESLDRAPSRVIFVARKGSALAPVLQWPDARPLVPGTARPWTDDYSDVLSALMRRVWR